VVLAFHGAMRIGAVWVGVNQALAPPEKQYILDDSGASVFLADAEEWRAALDDAPSDDRPGIEVDPDAPAGIAYTSGTTGHPKGAVHSQRNLLTPGAVVVETRGYGPDLRKGDCLPLTILNMMVLTTLLVAQAEGTCIVMDRIDAEGVAEWVREERVTVWNGPPALLHSLASNENVAPSDLASLREVWTGGADCPEAIRSRFEAKFGLPVLATYGLSEAPTIVAIDPPGGPHVDGASGIPLPHLRVRIDDSGEVCVGPQPDGRYRTMLGYWQRPEVTAETLRDGELHTGDIGFFDDDGYLHIRDRKSLVIIRGGANVYPAEVERVLQAAPGVAACAVVGVPDERLGERVVAAVEPAAGAAVDDDTLRAHCLEHLAKYKVPERFVVVDAFPRNSMGKIVRKELPALFA
jgi:long-chain acyl-CoA synthetase